MSTVAMLGSTGFVGTAVGNALRAADHAIVSITSPRLRVRTADACISAPTDFPELVSAIAEHLSGADCLIIAAGVPDASSQDTSLLLGANAALPSIAAAAAKTADVPRVILVSTAAVQGRIPKLDESTDVAPFSAYSWSKAVGEASFRKWAGARGLVYRPPSVHAPGRRVTVSLTRLARSHLSSVAGSGTNPTPQALLENVASAVAFLATTEKRPPEVVVHPSEGLTTAGLLQVLGGKPPRHLPTSTAKALVNLATYAGRYHAPTAANARRVEMCWFGQEQATSWLTTVGWTPPAGIEAWSTLGECQ
ncbi:NAD-dependent epimerase/dehydratase family protein [Janibacter sp. FSL W8-0316]|uniref:NAD-dependent epimerase/dehydratase family protein n=1 Tax=Janibacter sp. FSL W8-0316 TaxID=2975325 RepID=UPI00404690C2